MFISFIFLLCILYFMDIFNIYLYAEIDGVCLHFSDILSNDFYFYFVFSGRLGHI